MQVSKLNGPLRMKIRAQLIRSLMENFVLVSDFLLPCTTKLVSSTQLLSIWSLLKKRRPTIALRRPLKLTDSWQHIHTQAYNMILEMCVSWTGLSKFFKNLYWSVLQFYWSSTPIQITICSEKVRGVPRVHRKTTFGQDNDQHLLNRNATTRLSVFNPINP